MNWALDPSSNYQVTMSLLRKITRIGMLLATTNSMLRGQIKIKSICSICRNKPNLIPITKMTSRLSTSKKRHYYLSAPKIT